MSVPAVPGSVLHTVIPNLFQEKLIDKHYETSIIAQICNTDADNTGIKAMGDKVTFMRLADTTVRANVKGQDMVMEFLSHTEVNLYVNQSNYFYFGDDRINLKQYLQKDIMDRQVDDANKQVEKYIAKSFFSTVYASADATNVGATAGAESADYNLGITGTPIPVSKASICDQIADLSGVCSQQYMPAGDLFVVLPDTFRVMALQSELKDKGMTGKDSTLSNTLLGNVFGMDIYSTTFYTPIHEVSLGVYAYPIIFGHKSAICYVNQLTSMDYFEKMERTNAQAMRGVSVYDWAVIDPLMLGVWYAYKSQ